MKKQTIALILAALFLFQAMPGFAAKPLTLAELKTEAPERLVMTCQAGSKTIEIDAPVIMPEEDTLPIIKAQYLRVNTKRVDETYGIYSSHFDKHQAHRLAESSTYGIVVSPYGISPEGDVNPMTGQPSGMRIADNYSGTDWSFPLTRAATPANNPLAPEVPERLMRAVLVVAGADQVDLRLTGQLATGGGVRINLFHKKDPEDANRFIPAFEVYMDQPIPGLEKGIYHAGFAQYLHGAQIFGHQYDAEFRDVRSPAGFERTAFCVQALAEDDFFLLAEGLLEEAEVLVADSPLAPFAVIEQVIRDRVDSGKLKEVFSVELGYMIRVSEKPRKPNQEFDRDKTVLALTPVWQVRGIDSKHKQLLGSSMVTETGELFYDAPLALGMHGDYELRIDAETGSIIDDNSWIVYPRGKN